MHSLLSSARRARASAPGAVVPLLGARRAAHRVLVLVSPAEAARARSVLAAVRAGGSTEFDLLEEFGAFLRVTARERRSLDGFDAVVVWDPSDVPGHASRRAYRRVADRAATLRPTLVLRVGIELLDDDLIEQVRAGVESLLHHDRDRREPSGAAAWLRNSLDDDLVRNLDRIVEVTGSATGLGTAELNLLGTTRVWTVSTTARAHASWRRDDSLCDIAAFRDRSVVMADTWLDSDACRRSPTRGQQPIRFYAGSPLRSTGGDVIGVLCVHDPAPQHAARFDLALLQDLALLAEAELLHAARAHSRPTRADVARDRSVDDLGPGLRRAG